MLGIFLDIETSGLDCYRHKVLEIAFKILNLDSGEEKASFHAVVKHSQEVWDQVDPLSININGFSFEKMLQGKEKAWVSDEIIRIFREQNIQKGQSVFICQNPAFDRPFFSQLVDPYRQERENWPYHWLDLASMFWAIEAKKRHLQGQLGPDETKLSKNAIAEFYGLPTEAMPHSAFNGVNHLILCYNFVVGFESQTSTLI